MHFYENAYYRGSFGYSLVQFQIYDYCYRLNHLYCAVIEAQGLFHLYFIKVLNAVRK